MKCLDCGYNITLDEIGEHEGHEIIEGFFEEEENGTDTNRVLPKPEDESNSSQKEKTTEM